MRVDALLKQMQRLHHAEVIEVFFNKKPFQISEVEAQWN
jgi:hypothetical protein